jgi:hypothetical protein
MARTILSKTSILDSTIPPVGPFTIQTVPNDGVEHTYVLTGYITAKADPTKTHGESVAFTYLWTDRYGGRSTIFNIGVGESIAEFTRSFVCAPNTIVQFQGQGGANFPQGFSGYLVIEELTFP